MSAGSPTGGHLPVSRRQFLRLGSLAALGAATGGGRYLLDANRLEVSQTAMDLPGRGPDMVLALVADLHAPQPGFDMARMAASANRFRPDLVVIVGDAVNRRGDEGLVEDYGLLGAKAGKFAVVGNWENWGRVDRVSLARHYARAGVALLDNAVTELTELGVRLVGLDESTNGHPDPSLVPGADGDTLTLVLHHSPSAFDTLPLPEEGAGLMLSGHTHGGQLAPFGRALVLPAGSGPYPRGPFARGRHRLYVSRGLGNSHVPIRVGARPELAILRVRRTG